MKLLLSLVLINTALAAPKNTPQKASIMPSSKGSRPMVMPNAVSYSESDARQIDNQSHYATQSSSNDLQNTKTAHDDGACLNLQYKGTTYNCCPGTHDCKILDAFIVKASAPQDVCSQVKQYCSGVSASDCSSVKSTVTQRFGVQC